MQSEQTRALGCEGYLFDSFEASLKLGTLQQKGARLKVQYLPFRMLIALLERPGELVTKEELACQLWGQQILGDADKSLYVMAGKLRQVLGDNANEPRFIQTVSGQGYKFIGSVTPVLAAPQDLTTPLSSTSTSSGLTVDVHSARAVPESTRTSLPVKILAGVLLALFGAGAAILIYGYRHRALMTGQEKIVLADFTNSTGNSDLDQTLSAPLQSQLQESPYLNLIPEQRYRGLVKNPESASLQDELRACVKLDGQVLLKGDISAVEQGYQITLTAWRCVSGKLLTSERANAPSQDSILPALDLATDHMRRRLGEPEDSLRKFNVPAVQATTASLAALKAFNYGDEMRFKGDPNAAIASFKLAIDLDPQFALAYARLGTLYSNTEQFGLSAKSNKQAFELRSSRASDRERLYIVTHYYEFATGQINRAIESYNLWHTLYPRETVPIQNLADLYLLIGQPERALDLAKQSIQQEPAIAIHYELLERAYVNMGDYANARKLCDDLVHGKINSMIFHRACFDAAFAQGDEAAMQRQLQWGHGNAEEGEAISDSAWVAMYYGKLSEAKMLFRKAEQSALDTNSSEFAADIGLDQAMVEAEVGLLPIARTDAQRVLKLPFESASEQAYAARVLARSGNTTLSQIVAGKAERTAPLDDLVNSAMLPTARAAVDLQKANPASALDDLGSRLFDFCICTQKAPGYYRGLAYLQNKQPALAIREFQQVLDHKALTPSFSIYVVLSQLELGHAYQLMGDARNASTAYLKLEQTWKDADPGFPPLQRLRQYEAALLIAK
jgi:DNA-binding winged helix-turn-helix (wHTH) protein/tetratricopeptide (TPR) repeat protein